MFEELKGKKALITGASGFIGKFLCKRLVELGVEVHGIHKRSNSKKNINVVWWQGNLNNLDYVRLLVRNINPDYIIHLAGHSVGHKHKEEIIPSLDGNLLTTINILLASFEVKCKKIILPGSMEEPELNGMPATPTSPYAAAKYSASIYARMFHSLYKTPISIARIFMVYGPDQENHSKLIPYTILSALSHKPLNYSSGRRKIDWIYIDDVVDGLVHMLVQGNIDGQTIDIGSGNLTTVKNIVEKTVQLIGNGSQATFGLPKDRPNEHVAVADLESTFKKIKWKPKVPLDEGLRKTIEYYKTLSLKIFLFFPEIFEPLLPLSA